MAHRRSKHKRHILIIVITIVIAIAISTAFISYKFFFNGKANIQKQNAKEDIPEYRLKHPQFNLFGIDISEYQQLINWDKVFEENQIDFVFVRSSAGKNKKDKYFDYNWEQLEKNSIPRGAYHYYRPNENSSEQALFYIKTVEIKRGDFPPILDIEKYSKIQSINRLKNGLLNWLNIVENHYKMLPIIYTYHNFYTKVLLEDSRFAKYPVWIAHYSTENNKSELVPGWTFWQFTETGKIKGINGNIDIDVFCCDTTKFDNMLKR